LSPRSPDLNITENVWAALEHAVWKRGIPKDLAELELWIKEHAEKTNFKHLYDTIRPRTAEVFSNGGNLLDASWRKVDTRRKKKTSQFPCIGVDSPKINT